MRIAMIAYTLYSFDPRVRRAAEALAERGHQVDIFAVSDRGPNARNDEGRLRIHFLRLQKKQTGLARYSFEYGMFFMWAFVRVSLLQPRRRYDVVYVHNMPNFLVFAGLLAKLGGARIVLDIHDPTTELLAALRGTDLPKWVQVLANAEERISISFADELITVNEMMRRRLNAASRRPVEVVMNLPDPGRFAPLIDSGEKGGLDWIVYTGSIAHRNGLDLAVKAFSLIAGEFPALRFRIIGEGPALKSVMQLTESLGVADRVDFRGLVPYSQIPFLLSDAIAGISPQKGGSFGSLVFSMKVAEYITLGLPVICSGTSTMRHYFSDDEMLFFEPESIDDMARAIRELLTNPELAEKRAARSRTKLDELAWPVQKQKLVQAVEAVARSRKRHARGKTGRQSPWSARSAERE